MVELALIAALMGLGAYVTNRKSAASSPTPSGQRVITLDEAISDSDRDAVIQAVLYATNPTVLDALGTQMTSKGLPCASYECSYRAWEMRGASGPPPQRPASCATVAEASPIGLNVPGVPPEVAAAACALLDSSLDTATCSAVLTALATETDPGKLAAFAQALAPTHPKSAGALAAKAQQILQGAAPAPAPASVSPGLVPSAVAAPAPATTAQASGIPDIGGGSGVPFAPMSDDIAAAAALSPSYEGGGNSQVEGSVAAVAAAAVAQAAQTIDPAQSSDTLAPATAPASAPAPATAPAQPAGFWYIQMRASDTPWPATIAKFGSGSKRSESLSELFNLNPHLHTFPGSGVIASFKPGDLVNVPGAWSDNLIKKGFKLKKG
jgi:hypothetical protein